MTATPDHAAAAPAVPNSGGAFAPLRHRLFAVIWAATVLGNVGTFMRDVASAWLVTEISPTPAAVALIQAAASLPIFLFAIPAGVLSDILDRRKFLIAVQVMLGTVSAVLAGLAATGAVSVTGLALLTFLGGTGAALAMPTWQAIVPELVPRADLKGAVALGSLGFNIARAVGPALGGVALGAFGAAVTYGLDVASYFLVIGALIWWRRDAAADDELREHFGGALRAGLRFARASRDMHRLLWRAVLFFVFASAVWALLPLVARQELGGSPGFYGLMLGSVGAGAILGALLLPRLRAAVGQDRLVLGAALVTAASTILLAPAQAPWHGIVIMVILGAAWIAILTTLNATMQAILPNWTRGRGLAIYLTVFNGAMAAGSLGWGGVAQAVGIDAALVTAGLGLTAASALAFRARLPSGEADLMPSMHWPEPIVADLVPDDRGPVLITITYRVAPEDRAAFAAVLDRLSAARRRDGAYAWGLTEDAADPERLVEWFFVESWAEHRRQHRRVSRVDADLQAEAVALHRGAEPPAVQHYLSVDPRAAAWPRPPDPS